MALFSEATSQQLQGDLGESLRLYRMVEEIDPHYPGLQTQIRAVEAELGRPYIGPGDRVMARRVITPRPMEDREKWDKPARAAPSAAPVSLGCWIAAIAAAVLVVVAIIALLIVLT